MDTKFAWEEVNKYLNLEIEGKRIVCPYFTNHIGKAFLDAMHDGGLDPETTGRIIKLYNERKYPLGWWRGKGTPEQIIEATLDIAKMEKTDLTKGGAEAIREFMMLHGMGIDCSGFVYNVLSFAGVKFELDVFKAGAFSFAEKISQIIDYKEVKSGDLILIKNKEGEYTHVVLVLADENNKLKIVQSTSTKYPMGVFVDDLDILADKPRFGFVPELGTDWNVLWDEGRLEFRRL